MYHVVWATHNSRTSIRMIQLNIKKGKPVKLSNSDEAQFARFLYQIADEIKVDIKSLNICVDHVHLLINIKYNQLPSVIRKLKSKSVNLYKKENKIETSLKVWQKNYYSEKIKDNFHFNNTMKYIQNNRVKHNLPQNEKLQDIMSSNTT